MKINSDNQKYVSAISFMGKLAESVDSDLLILLQVNLILL